MTRREMEVLNFVSQALRNHVNEYHINKFDEDYNRIQEAAASISENRGAEPVDMCAETSKIDLHALAILESYKHLDFRLLNAIHRILESGRIGQDPIKNIDTAIEYLQRYVQTETSSRAWDRLRDMGISAATRDPDDCPPPGYPVR